MDAYLTLIGAVFIDYTTTRSMKQQLWPAEYCVQSLPFMCLRCAHLYYIKIHWCLMWLGITHFVISGMAIVWRQQHSKWLDIRRWRYRVWWHHPNLSQLWFFNFIVWITFTANWQHPNKESNANYMAQKYS